ncbi:hypothetical protein SO694_00190017 [Aureococcus anophagefferens]|uniref:Uncharacterized protein n=1 Tax=Aureococcus anophagefferens TaxID=44056 RepID=A0ABR1FP00_AURAN
MMTPWVFVALGCLGRASGADVVVSVRDLQFVEHPCDNDWSPYLGRHVALEKVYVTAVAFGRFAVTDAAEVAAWSGVVVDAPRLAPDTLGEGMRVSVKGRMMEVGGETRVVDVTSVVVHADLGVAAVVPADVTTEAISANVGECERERWEGCLVRAAGAEILADPDAGGAMILDDGTGPAVLNDGFLGGGGSVLGELRAQWAAGGGDDDDAWAVDNVRGATVDAVVGVVVMVAGRYELLPRRPGDVAAGSPPAGSGLAEVDIRAVQKPAGDLDDACDGASDVGDNSPYVLREVATRGYVSAVGRGEFFLQQGAAARPWEGVAVSLGEAPAPDFLRVGAAIKLAGTAEEFEGMTRLARLVAARPLSGVPDVDVAPLDAKTGWLACGGAGAPEGYPEALEGVLVRLRDVVLASDADPVTGMVAIDDGSGVARLDDRILDTDAELQLRWNTLGLEGRELRELVGVVTFAYGTFQVTRATGGRSTRVFSESIGGCLDALCCCLGRRDDAADGPITTVTLRAAGRTSS